MSSEKNNNGNTSLHLSLKDIKELVLVGAIIYNSYTSYLQNLKTVEFMDEVSKKFTVFEKRFTTLKASGMEKVLSNNSYVDKKVVGIINPENISSPVESDLVFKIFLVTCCAGFTYFVVVQLSSFFSSVFLDSGVGKLLLFTDKNIGQSVNALEGYIDGALSGNVKQISKVMSKDESSGEESCEFLRLTRKTDSFVNEADSKVSHVVDVSFREKALENKEEFISWFEDFV